LLLKINFVTRLLFKILYCADHLAEGTCNFTCLESQHEKVPVRGIHDEQDAVQDEEEEPLQEIREVPDEDDEEKERREEEEAREEEEPLLSIGEAAMVGIGSPKLNVMARGSPKLRRFVSTTSATEKKGSPTCSGVRRIEVSPRGMMFIVSSCFLVNVVYLYY
jgi:hypothetical protein